MSGSYEDLMGDEQDPKDHPVHNVPQATQHYAGEVVSFPNKNSTPLLTKALNERSMENIAKGGPSSVDTTNLAKRIVKP